MTHILQRTAPIFGVLALTATGLLSACATTEDGLLRPNYPVRAPETAAPPETAPAPRPVPDEPIAPAPTPPVESRPLEPLPPAAAPAPPPAPSITYETVTRRTVTGQVVDVDGPPKVHTVKKGENLQRIARALDTDVETLAKTNRLKEPYLIKPGQKLKGPGGEAKAYVITSGDTLFAIARRFGVSASAIAGENEMSIDDSLRVGRRLRLPAGYKDSGPVTTTARVPVASAIAAPPPPPVPVPAARPQPETPPQSAPPPASPPAPALTTPPPVSTSTPTPPSSAAPSVPLTAGDQQVSQLGRGRFVWPLQGEVLSDFGPKAAGQRNDGVNIRARAGDTVRAAAAGDVVYAGDQVPGFGNLVLIKHADGWVTAYGHLARVDVKMQQKVTQGQQIGQAGDTGGVSEPQLHFEVRYAATPAERARPVDPRLVLPR